jgi:hypothetical protein
VLAKALQILILLCQNTFNISLTDEFDDTKAHENKMVINYSKTKEIVFCRPNPRHSLYPDPLACIKQVSEAKLLGVVLNNKLAFEAHIQYILRQCNQRLYLIK